jgi:Xaa-Pro aminopeptidase
MRRKRLIALFAKAKIDALLVSSPANVRYLSGFTGSNGIVLVTPKVSWLLTDPRYTIRASQESDCKVKIVKGPLIAGLPSVKGTLGFEADHTTVTQRTALGKAVSAKLKPVTGLVESLREIKEQSEIDLIRASVHLNSAAFRAAMAAVQPGMKESALAAEIDHQMRLLGAESAAFETIVASGPRTALPHAQPGPDPIRTNELILIDMGAQLSGYASDMTRMAWIGKPTTKARRLYNAVLEAQLEAVAAVRDGETAEAVDGKARGVLRKHGLDQRFVHSTGHGLGLEIHEQPRIATKSKTILREGMVITIEPGIYLEGDGGIRIEDTVLVTRTGCEILTTTPKELLVL